MRSVRQTDESRRERASFPLSLERLAFEAPQIGSASPMSRPNPIFSGSHVSKRTINLGGATRQEGTSQDDLIKRAKRQREEREEQRLRERAAAKIQVRTSLTGRRGELGVRLPPFDWVAELTRRLPCRRSAKADTRRGRFARFCAQASMSCWPRRRWSRPRCSRRRSSWRSCSSIGMLGTSSELRRGAGLCWEVCWEVSVTGAEERGELMSWCRQGADAVLVVLAQHCKLVGASAADRLDSTLASFAPPLVSPLIPVVADSRS